MKKNKSVKDVVSKAKRIIAGKDDEIRLLKTALIAANGEKTVSFKMPDTMEVRNFPEIQRVKIENHQERMKVEVVNHKEVQAVEVKNHPKEMNVRILNHKDAPDVQKVEVTNQEKASGWVPEIIKHAAVAMVTGIVKRLDLGITVRLDDTERLKPIPVIMVDMRGRPVSMASQGPTMIPMAFSSGGGTKPPSAIHSGRKTVTTPGTAVALGTGVCRQVIVTCPPANGGSVYIGDSTVSAVSGSEKGLLLLPAGSATIDIDNISKVFIDSTAGGEGVTFTYLT